MFSAGVASAATRTALINASTVAGGVTSEEAQIAMAQGYAVSVVTDSAWGAMTASQFGSYDLLIAGDPNCGTLPPGLVSSAPVYGPVVLGTSGGRTAAGNRVLVGTDPALHDYDGYSAPNARGTIIRTGIAFAGKQPGTTGMYFDSSCGANYYGQSTQTLSILNALSSGSGTWTINSSPPCGGSVSLFASNPSFADLTTASLQGWGCSVHETFPTFKSDWSALAVATDTPTKPTCGVDHNTGANACGQAYVLIAGSGIVVVSGSIALTPADATAPAGGDHTVAAKVTSAGSPLAGQTVTFSITGQNAGATGTCAPAGCVTDAAGNVSFTYHDGNGAGDDTIKGSFTDARGSLQTATAQQHWTAQAADPPKATLDPANDTTVNEGSAHTYRYTTNATTSSVATSCGANGAKVPGSDTATSFECSFPDGPASTTVSVTPTDSDGLAGDPATQSVSVANVAPTAKLDPGNPSNVTESMTERAFAYTISDPGHDDVASVDTSCGTGGEKITESHTNDSGSFTCVFAHGPASSTVSVNATDSDGDTGNTDTQKVTVSDPPITAKGSPVTAVEAAAFNAQKVASFADPTSYSTAGEYSASINWGDGSSSAGTIVKTADGEFDVLGSHTYAEEGTSPVTVTITDTDNPDNSATATTTAKIADAPIHAQGRSLITTPAAYSGPVATFTDEANGPIADFSATVNWGDGSSSAGTISGPDGSGKFTVSGAHVYATTGPFKITVKVDDKGGSTDSATTDVLVYAFATDNGGSFTISDKQATMGNAVTYWGAQWEKANPFSSGVTGSSAFKGFIEAPASKAAPKCATTWTSSPGNSSGPPSSVPAYMAVVVASTESKSGSTITGDVKRIVVVKTAAGYDANPGHAGTGTIVGSVCG